MMKKTFVLLLLIILIYNPIALISPVVPQTGNDGRAHLARIMCFPQCLLQGDVDPYYYFGEAYMLYYGPLFFVITSPVYHMLSPLLGKAFAAVEAYKFGVIVVDFLLSLVVLRMTNSLLLSITSLFIPPLLFARMMGAYPYMLSASLALHAALDLKRKRRRAWYLLSLAILAHPYGVINDFIVLLWSKRISLSGILLLIPPLLPLVHGFLSLGYESPPLVELGPLAAIYAYYLLRKSERGELEWYFSLVAFLFGTTNTLVLLGLFPPSLSKVLAWRFFFPNATLLVFAKRINIIGMKSKIAIIIILLFVSQFSLLYEKIPDLSNLIGRTIVSNEIAFDYSTPVAWAHAYGYTSASGGFHQGDPLFLNLTIYYEWMAGLWKDEHVLKNLALISGAGLVDVKGSCIQASRYLLFPLIQVTIFEHCIERVSQSSMVFKVNPIGIDMKNALHIVNFLRIYGDGRLVFVRDNKPALCNNCTLNRMCKLNPSRIDFPNAKDIVSPMMAMMINVNKDAVRYAIQIAKCIERKINVTYESWPYDLEGNVLKFYAQRGWYLVMASKVLVKNVYGAKSYETVEGLLLLKVDKPGIVWIEYGVEGRRDIYELMLLLYTLFLPLPVLGGRRK